MRTVRGCPQQLHRIARRKGEQAAEALKAAYARLWIAAASRTGAASRGCSCPRGRGDDPDARRLADRLEEVLPRLSGPVVQAKRRVPRDDPVPSPRSCSLFEPHTQVIRRLKAASRPSSAARC